MSTVLGSLFGNFALPFAAGAVSVETFRKTWGQSDTAFTDFSSLPFLLLNYHSDIDVDIDF